MTFVPMQMAYADSAFSGGNGTMDDPYLITSANDFKQLATEVNGGNNYSNTYFKIPETVTETIELSTDDGYVPIGNDTNQFEGTFDGGNHTINLNLTGERLVGLFGEGEENSNLCNIRTTGSVSMTGYYAGGIVANMYGNVVNCHNEASVTGYYHVGGIVGISDNSKYIINCSNSGAIVGNMNVGGIVGNISTLKVINCLNTGTVQGSSCGGIAGYSGLYSKIYNCINNGLVTKKSDGNYIGGLFGEKNGNNDAFGNCYYNGTINSEIGDFGRLTNNSEHYTVRDFAKTSEEIVSEDVLMSLNLYARANKPNDTQLLYWKAENGIPVLTEEEPVFPYTITNNQPNYITVAANAMADTSVEIKTDKIPAYLKLTKITVNDNEIKANSDGKYIFTMPKNDVTVDADFEFMLEKDSYDNYIVSTDEELLVLSKAVNDGYEAGNVVLTADVTASTENGFEPIGTNDNPYKGNFNGKGHTVTLDITSGTKYNSTVATGLFGITSDAYIGNLVIKGSVDGGDDTSSYTGALVGIMKSKRDLYNVYSEVSVSGSGFVGGFIGYAQGGVTFRNAVNNGTVVQKNTADDKKLVGTFVGIGNYNYDTAYYNSEKNSGVFCAGYDNDENKVTTNIGSDIAKTTEELFSDSTMDALNVNAQRREYMYWDFVTENEIQTAKIVEKCPVPVYEIYHIYDEDIIQTSADYSRAGKTIEVEVDLYNDYSNLINSVKEIKVTDSKGKSIKVTKTSDNTYEFTMPKSQVNIQAICDYNLTTDSEGVYYISDADDLVAFARIVEAGQTDANAKVVAKSINYRDYSGYWAYSNVGLIGKNAPYTGTFDGNGAEITADCILFAETDGAVIKNVNINSHVYNEKSAGIVQVANNTSIDNCDVYISLNYGICGGIAAEAYNSTITNCCVTATGYIYEFGGIVYSTSGNTVIANCVLKNSGVNVTSLYGGIVGEACGKTEIYNCANSDIFNSRRSGGIVSYAEMSGLTLENNMYYEENDCYDVYYDIEKDECISKMVDKDSTVSEQDADGLYIPAKLNEYVRANPNQVKGTTLKTWGIDYNNEPSFANNKNPELYLIKQSGVKADTLINGDYARGALPGNKVTICGIADSAVVAVTDVNGNDIKLTKNEDGYEFTMPKCDVTLSAVLDTGINETTVIDGKTYVVVKNASDFVKAVKSIADGNSELNVYIAENINLTAEELAEYPIYTDEMKQSYNGIFDGAGHTITFDGLKQSMLYYIGSEGIIKNITVDGTISSIKSDSSDETSVTESIASGIAMANNGQIVNCINKADISGIKASGITILNNGIVYNCMNKGDITGLKLAGAITCSNSSMVIIASNEGKIINQNENPSWNNMTGNDDDNGLLVQDFSSETDSSNKIEFAATANAIAEQIQLSDNLEFKISEDALKWSVSKTELVFADDENIPYYMFLNNGVEQPYKQGETVEFTVDTSSFEEDLVISDITLKSQTGDLKIKVSPVEGKKDTFTFTMPNVMCRLVVKTEVKGIEKDEDGYCLVGTLDDLNKVKQTIDLGNNDINIKLTNNIVRYDGNPIGEYNGTFDGNGHSITLAMNDESNDYQHYGLFEKLDTDAVVKNLTINGSIKANVNYVGAVAGLCDGAIINCVNNATVTNALKDGVTGGIIGQNMLQKSPILISNCVNNGEVNGYNVGGIIGYSAGYIYNFSKITDCVNNGKLNAENNGAGIIVVGSHCMVTNCVNNANINANKNTGGIIGVVQYGTKAEIINCANNGSVVSKETAAGIATTYGAITVKNCLNSGNVSGSLASYAIAYCNNYYDDSINDFMILNSFYVQTNDVNTEIESSNIVIKNDLSKAVSESDISSGYVAAMLNNGVTDGLNYWNVKNSNVVFADDESDLYYAIEIAPNITGGTVTADKQFAKAGETVTLTVTPETEGKSAIITGVELDENNSFVMPDRGVKINAVFGDTFTGTEKNDVIELEKNVEMDEIKLADYVKFENDAISRDFTFTLADGNVLPDGLKLSYARISGTPKKAGTYTVVFDVTDNGSDMISSMALEPNKALSNAQLTLTFRIAKIDEIEPIGKYKDKIDIKEKITDENVVLTITPTDGTIDKIATSKLYVAEYDGEGQLIGIKLGENQNVDGKLIITAESPKTDNFKLMLWDKTNNPIINAISDIH